MPRQAQPPAAPNPRRKPPRATLNIDLGDLAAAVAAQSQAAGHTRSSWVREAIQTRLQAPEASPASPARDTGTPHAYRAWLGATLTAKLDTLVARSGRRSRSTVLRALIEGADLGLRDATADATSKPLTPEAIQSLARSNHELVAIGRNLNQIAKGLHLYPGKTTVADRMSIDAAVTKIGQHLEQSSRVVAALRPQLRTAARSPSARSTNPKAKRQ